MAAGINLASKYSTNVDERFYKESQAAMALNNDYEFTGVETVKVYSIPVAAMTDYTKSGMDRYGTPSDLTRNVQTLTLTKDRAFTFIIDKGDKLMSQMVSDAGKALSRQIREVIVPEYDTYVFQTLASAATAAGNYATDAIPNDTGAYEAFLNAQEKLGNANIPDQGRVCFCSYRYANLLKLDPAFMQYGDKAHEMTQKGVIGEVDGCKIVKVPATRLPLGCSFILTHPIAATGPKVLEDYKIHDNPPGLSGWLVEGREIYDCFVLNEKRNAIFYHGSQAVLGALDARTFAFGSGTTAIMVNGQPSASGNKFAFVIDDTAKTLTYKAEITIGSSAGNYTDMGTSSVYDNSGSGVSSTQGKIATVVEYFTDANDSNKTKVLAVGTAVVNVG